jgi:hypothetical protein
LYRPPDEDKLGADKILNMKLMDILELLKTRQKAEELAKRMMPGVEYYDIELYMEDKVALDSELRF